MTAAAIMQLIQKKKFTLADKISRWFPEFQYGDDITVEMLLKFYDIGVEDLNFTKDKYVVNCGIFGLEKIMDDIASGTQASVAISKFVHGIAYNAWTFAKRPSKLFLSGGFCNHKCFVDSLKNYCDVQVLGQFILCEGLIDE